MGASVKLMNMDRVSTPDWRNHPTTVGREGERGKPPRVAWDAQGQLNIRCS